MTCVTIRNRGTSVTINNKLRSLVIRREGLQGPPGPAPSPEAITAAVADALENIVGANLTLDLNRPGLALLAF